MGAVLNKRNTFWVGSGLILLLTALSACTTAPKQDVSPAPLVEVEFSNIMGLTFFDVVVNGSRPLSMSLDTGFDVNVLDLETAGEIGITIPDISSEAQPGGAVSIADLGDQSIELGGFVIEGVPVTGITLTGLGQYVGRPLEGVIGHDFLVNYVVDIDYGASVVRLYDKETWTYNGTGRVLPVAIVEKEVLVDAIVELPNGREVAGKFKLDTGSVDTLGLSLNFVRDNALIEPSVHEVSAMGVAVGGETEGRLFRARSVRLGDVKIDQPIIGYTIDSAGFEERTNAGTIGAGLFGHGHLYLDYARNRIILEDNFEGRNPREDTSGVFLVSPGPDYQKIVVAAVIAGTAGDKAGLKVGDQILSVDGVPLSLADMRQIFTTEQTLILTCLRGDEQMVIELKLSPIVPFYP